ncbi:MAG: macro domain-containing protein [Clostridia bacterium]|nr:macro domain-containing protein [Clostridia bacterium]MDD4798980.1 macro domain-containing protein [Clostridia bacterium]
MPLQIIKNDITKIQAEAIVNAANSSLTQGGGVCGAIFAAAGADELRAECEKIGNCQVGQAVITGGGRLLAKHIIHTVGPIWQGGGQNEEALLSACYTNSLNLAVNNGLTSVAFPLISAGIFGYPKEAALRVAITAIGEFLQKQNLTVYLVFVDKDDFQFNSELLSDISKFIKDNYDESTALPPAHNSSEEELQLGRAIEASVQDEFVTQIMSPPALQSASRFNQIMAKFDKTFLPEFLSLLSASGLNSQEFCRKANLDQRICYKLRTAINYEPQKRTVWALAIALSLSFEQAIDLLHSAGYAYSAGSKADLIVEYFIRKELYDILLINQALFALDEEQLGA